MAGLLIGLYLVGMPISFIVLTIFFTLDAKDAMRTPLPDDIAKSSFGLSLIWPFALILVCTWGAFELYEKFIKWVYNK